MPRLIACAVALVALGGTARASEPSHSAALDDMIVAQAHRHGVPEKLVRRIVMRESRYNPSAHHRSFWGLMQISYPTARSMGFKGSPQELLDPLVNLTYAVPYLANAFIIAGKQEDAAVRLYASGYYQTAKNRRLLSELRTAESDPVTPGQSFLVATATPVSNLITTVANVPNARRIAEAAPRVEAPPVEAAADSSGLEPETVMSRGKDGLEPPRKWTKDGGVSVIARGEQGIEQIAAYRQGDGTETTSKHAAHARGHSRKTTVFASLDAPGTGAPQDQAGPQGQPQPRSQPQMVARRESVDSPPGASGQAYQLGQAYQAVQGPVGVPTYDAAQGTPAGQGVPTGQAAYAAAQAYAAPGAERGEAAASEAAIAAATAGPSARRADDTLDTVPLRGDADADAPRPAEHARKTRAAKALAKRTSDARVKLADAGEPTSARSHAGAKKSAHQTEAAAAKDESAR